METKQQPASSTPTESTNHGPLRLRIVKAKGVREIDSGSRYDQRSDKRPAGRRTTEARNSHANTVELE